MTSLSACTGSQIATIISANKKDTFIVSFLLAAVTGIVLQSSPGTASVSATLSADRLNMLPTTSASARIALNPKKG